MLHISIYLSIYLLFYLLFYISIYLSIYLSIVLSIYLSIVLSIYLLFYLSIVLSIYIYVIYNVGIADVEAEGYRVLASLGAGPLRRVVTCGGGAVNPVWRRLRERRLGVPVLSTPEGGGEASLGAALLGLREVP